MIGLTLACTMAIVGDSAKASVDKSVEENFVGDYVVSNVIGVGFSPSIGERIGEVDGRRPRGPRALRAGRARRRRPVRGGDRARATSTGSSST